MSEPRTEAGKRLVATSTIRANEVKRIEDEAAASVENEPTTAQQERFKHRANMRADRAEDILSRSRTLLDKVIDAIEQADRIAEAADGPVLHVRDVLTDDDWRVLYQRLVEARSLLPTQASDSPEKP